MQKQTSIYIPKPCHEDWNKMTPTQQGKLCSACNKQVVDFSLMSDNQILNFLSDQSGKLCGRFDTEQLQRPLVETKVQKKKSWWMAFAMPLLFLFERSEAQSVKSVGDTIYNTKPGEASICNPNAALAQVVGKIAVSSKPLITIKGKVVDEKGNALAHASIMHKEFGEGIITDSLGNFEIKVKSYNDSITLTASYVGFASSDKKLKITGNALNEVVIVLGEYQTGLSEVVVTSSAPLYGRLGGLVSVCTRVTVFEKIDSSFKKLAGISSVYPNPASKGSSMHIKIKNAGSYQMQLFDNQSRLIQMQEINVDAKNTTAQIELPSNIAVGMYYLRLINEQSKKQYTEKIIIQ
jgi:RNase P/RNase MRP subunit p29